MKRESLAHLMATSLQKKKVINFFEKKVYWKNIICTIWRKVSEKKMLFKSSGIDYNFDVEFFTFIKASSLFHSPYFTFSLTHSLTWAHTHTYSLSLSLSFFHSPCLFLSITLSLSFFFFIIIIITKPAFQYSTCLL